MDLWSKFKTWRERRKADKLRFPRRWLSYKQRVRDDVDAVFLTEAGKKFFDDKFTAALRPTQAPNPGLFAIESA